MTIKRTFVITAWLVEYQWDVFEAAFCDPKFKTFQWLNIEGAIHFITVAKS